MSEKNLHNQSQVTNNLSRNQWPSDYPERFTVPDEYVDWDIEYPGYNPVTHDAPRAESPNAKSGDYADPIDPNQVDWEARIAFSGPIRRDHDGYPLNPLGRTGIAHSRGKLNAWGPTEAVDPVITRTNAAGKTELLVVTRTDNGNVALPGGKLNVNEQNEVIESVTDAMLRETFEETGAELNFEGGRPVYIGPVDDERNTDNSWMATHAVHLPLSWDEAKILVLTAQEEDAARPEWVVADNQLINSLNASNGHMVRLALNI